MRVEHQNGDDTDKVLRSAGIRTHGLPRLRSACFQLSDPLAGAHNLLDDLQPSGNLALVRGCENRLSRDCAGRVRLRDRLSQEQGVARHDQRTHVGAPGAQVDAKPPGLLLH